MQPTLPMNTTVTACYTRAIDSLCDIIHTSFFLGKFAHALHTLRTSLDLISIGEVMTQDRLKLLLLYGRVLNVDHLLTRGDTDLLFSILHQAQELAEASQDQQSQADALSLLGQARCNATTIAIVSSGSLPFGTQNHESYTQALTYHEQALKIQEALHDTRGMCESLFGIGLIQQFWQHHDVARTYFTQTIALAEEHGHMLEQAEPYRHLTMDARFQSDLDTALTYAVQALAFREAGGFRPYQPLDHISLWDLYRKKGDTAQADWHIQQATLLAHEMGLSPVVASMVTSLKYMDDQQV